MKKPILLLIALSFFLGVPVAARAKVSVSLQLDRTEATLVDSIRMVVSISGTQKSDSQPVLKGLAGFDVQPGGTSSQVEIINGQVTARIEHTYFLQPKKIGNFEIGPAEVRVKGRTVRSRTTRLKIVAPAQSSGTDQGPLFLSAGLSAKRVYVEEQAVYTLKLYRRTRVSDLSLSLPEVEQLVFKQLGKPLEYKSVYNGQSYHVLEVRYALVPSKEGNYGIGPSRINLTVIEPRSRSPRSLFDDPFFSFSTGRPMTLTSEPLELSVLPLPAEGRPADFSGLVGSFEIESKLEPPTIKAGESATFTVRLSGRGNVNRIPDLKVPEMEQTKVYADQPVLKAETDAQGLAGSKTMKWAIVPEKEGISRVPPLGVSFFNTKTHQYEVIKTSPHVLSVLPGDKEPFQVLKNNVKERGPESPAKQEVKELGHDILPAHGSVRDLTAGFTLQPGSLSFWVVLLGPFFLYSATFLGLKLRNKTGSSMAASKAKKAAGNFAKKCRRKELSWSDLALSIRNYLNDRFGLSRGALTSQEAGGILESKGVSLDTARKLQAILQRLEDAIYTGKGEEICDSGEKISKLIRQIEREIR
ncbi:BatD family protein [Thermodesulfobacteriota bacterium]